MYIQVETFKFHSALAVWKVELHMCLSEEVSCCVSISESTVTLLACVSLRALLFSVSTGHLDLSI